MAITLLSALIIIAAYFLILYAGVAFIQDNRFSLPRRRRISTRYPIRRSGSAARM